MSCILFAVSIRRCLRVFAQPLTLIPTYYILSSMLKETFALYYITHLFACFAGFVPKENSSAEEHSMALFRQASVTRQPHGSALWTLVLSLIPLHMSISFRLEEQYQLSRFLIQLRLGTKHPNQRSKTAPAYSFIEHGTCPNHISS